MGQYINGYYVFAPVTSTDHAGLLWVASILSLLFGLITLLTRYHIKRRTFGVDDWLITTGTIFALAQYIALFVGMDDFGLGRSSTLLSDSDAVYAGRAIFASNCFFILALAFSKFSVIFFMKRLFTRDFRFAWLACNILIGFVAVWVVASILILTVKCGPETKLLGDRCAGQLTRWSIVAALDMLFEIAIIILSIVLVVPLQMSLEIKLTVTFAFFFRIFVAILAGIRVSRVAHYSHSSDPGLTVISNLIWQQIELGYALLSATIPTLKSFIRGYEKAMGWEQSYTKSGTHPTTGMFGNASYAMQSLRSKNSASHNASQNRDTDRVHDDDDTISGNLRPDKHKYKAKVYGPGEQNQLKRESSTRSSDSQHPIIRKDVQFSVSSESNPVPAWAGHA